MIESSWFDNLLQDLRSAYQAGVNDSQIAHALMAVRAGQPPGQAPAGHHDLVWRLAWLLCVRAPALDLRWLVHAVMATDKVYWGALELAELIDQVRELERAAAAAHGDLDTWLDAELDHPQIARLRGAATRPERVLTTSGAALADCVQSDLEVVQASVEHGDLLRQVAPADPRP